MSGSLSGVTVPESVATHRLATFAALGAGALLALQSAANGEMSRHLGQPMGVALWGFGTGLLVLTVGLVLSPTMRTGLRGIGLALRERRLRWWQCIGGCAGAMLVAVQAWSVPIVGIAIFSVCVVGGQTVSGLLVDRFGLGPAGHKPVTGLRVAAACVALLGVALAATAGGAGRFALAPALAAVAVGATGAVQQAFNGRVGVACGSTMTTTWQNFLTGSALLVVICGVLLVRSGPQAWTVDGPVPWWSLVGGLLGLCFIATLAWTVRVVGVLVTGLLTVAGQLVVALLLDLADPATRGDVGPQLVLGVFVTLLAAGAGMLANRPPSASRRASTRHG